MFLHHCSERAAKPANRHRFLPCFSFHQTAQFIEHLDSRLKSHPQIARRDLPLGRHAPPDLTQERFYLLRRYPPLQDVQELVQELAIGLRVQILACWSKVILRGRFLANTMFTKLLDLSIS